ncbi:hypothetical protein K2X33_06385 [bacterium]|nr:hypothetical protein [bacterium]
MRFWLTLLLLPGLVACNPFGTGFIPGSFGITADSETSDGADADGSTDSTVDATTVTLELDTAAPFAPPGDCVRVTVTADGAEEDFDITLSATLGAAPATVLKGSCSDGAFSGWNDTIPAGGTLEFFISGATANTYTIKAAPRTSGAAAESTLNVTFDNSSILNLSPSSNPAMVEDCVALSATAGGAATNLRINLTATDLLGTPAAVLFSSCSSGTPITGGTIPSGNPFVFYLKSSSQGVFSVSAESAISGAASPVVSNISINPVGITLTNAQNDVNTCVEVDVTTSISPTTHFMAVSAESAGAAAAVLFENQSDCDGGASAASTLVLDPGATSFFLKSSSSVTYNLVADDNDSSVDYYDTGSLSVSLISIVPDPYIELTSPTASAGLVSAAYRDCISVTATLYGTPANVQIFQNSGANLYSTLADCEIENTGTTSLEFPNGGVVYASVQEGPSQIFARAVGISGVPEETLNLLGSAPVNLKFQPTKDTPPYLPTDCVEIALTPDNTEPANRDINVTLSASLSVIYTDAACTSATHLQLPTIVVPKNSNATTTFWVKNPSGAEITLTSATTPGNFKGTHLTLDYRSLQIQRNTGSNVIGDGTCEALNVSAPYDHAALTVRVVNVAGLNVYQTNDCTGSAVGNGVNLTLAAGKTATLPLTVKNSSIGTFNLTVQSSDGSGLSNTAQFPYRAWFAFKTDGAIKQIKADPDGTHYFVLGTFNKFAPKDASYPGAVPQVGIVRVDALGNRDVAFEELVGDLGFKKVTAIDLAYEGGAQSVILTGYDPVNLPIAAHIPDFSHADNRTVFVFEDYAGSPVALGRTPNGARIYGDFQAASSTPALFVDWTSGLTGVETDYTTFYERIQLDPYADMVRTEMGWRHYNSGNIGTALFQSGILSSNVLSAAFVNANNVLVGTDLAGTYGIYRGSSAMPDSMSEVSLTKSVPLGRPVFMRTLPSGSTFVAEDPSTTARWFYLISNTAGNNYTPILPAGDWGGLEAIDDITPSPSKVLDVLEISGAASTYCKYVLIGENIAAAAASSTPLNLFCLSSSGVLYQNGVP